MQRFSNYLWLILGFICLILGTVGIFLPILPTVPFYLATIACFAKGSKKMHEWFVNSELYKNHLEHYHKTKTMTIKHKVCVLLSVSLVVAFGIFMMKRVPIGQISLAIVWLAHMYYFLFRVPTVKDTKN